MKHIANISFGCDSIAMCIKLIENNEPLDELVFFDTGMEFECIYRNKKHFKNLFPHIKITTLTLDNSFLWYMLDKPVKHKDGSMSNGYQWCGGKCRWATTKKQSILNKYIGNNYSYIGITCDEIRRTANKPENQIYPLFRYKMYKEDCKKLCYEYGFNWNENGIELYDILDRVSCWCSANKNKHELEMYYKYLPEYWSKLMELQNKIDRPFKPNKSLFDFEKEFRGDK